MSTIRDLFRKISNLIDSIYKKSRSTLERFAVFRFIEHLLLKFSRDEGSVRASAITYYVLQSIFPLLLGLISLLGFFIPYGSVREAVLEALSGALPVSSNVIVETLDSVVSLRGTIGIISLVLLLWSGSNLFANVRRALNRAWGVHGRQFFIAKGIDLIMVAGAAILLLLSIVTTAAAQFFDGSASAALTTFGGRVLAFIFSFGLFSLLYKYVPNTKTYWRWTWPGALLTAVFFQVGAIVFVVYVANFTNFQNIYGSLGSVIVLLYWIYLSADVLIIGAELNAELQRTRSH